MSGLFITLEGGEGSGKSTQASLLKHWFADLFPGREILVTREPGGTDQAEEGKFFWMSTGKPVTYENWNAGEPNNFQ